MKKILLVEDDIYYSQEVLNSIIKSVENETQTIDLISTLSDTQDWITAHSLGVSIVSMMLARQIGYLTEKEIDAIAAFCAYSYDFKQARLTKDQATLQMAQIMEQTWKRLCSAARVPDYINQNEMDEILNVSTSWDRKRFGKSYKPMK